jgi:hypothetical protein
VQAETADEAAQVQEPQPVHEAERVSPAGELGATETTADRSDRGDAPVEPMSEAGRRVAEQRTYRAQVDLAYGKARDPAAHDEWAEAVPALHASWEVLREKYRYEEHPEPAPQADGGSWRGKGGRTLDAASNAEIDVGYARIREVGENVIGPAILRIAAEDPTRTLAGFDQRIKGEDRLKEKVADEMRSTPGITPSQALASIADVVRFTFTYEESAYTAGVRKDVERLEVAGFTQVERRNTWSSEQYKGINTRWREPKSGVIFEVQFHTQASLEAKELTHGAYEQIRSIGDEAAEGTREAAELKKFQRQVNGKVPIPPGVMEYEGYRPERRNDRRD